MELVTKPYFRWSRQCFIYILSDFQSNFETKFSVIALYEATFSFILLSFFSVAEIRIPADTAVFYACIFCFVVFIFLLIQNLPKQMRLSAALDNP